MRIPLDHPVRSLVWDGDELVDWVRGGARWDLEGGSDQPQVNWGYSRLDGAIAFGPFAVVYERTGTAGLLLHPVALFAHGDRVLLGHCPDSYARIEIDDAPTGERLTRAEQTEADFFHSRLAASPDGRTLLSAVWIWHPWDQVVWFDVERALRDPTSLDELEGAPGSPNVELTEHSSAAWLDARRIVVGGGTEAEYPEEAAEADAEHPRRLRPEGIAVFDAATRACLSSAALGYPPGAMMAVGTEHVVTLFHHPRLVALDSGRVVREWPDLPTDEQVSSIIVGSKPYTPVALDPERRRFAVARPDAIHIVDLR
jgi:hypothetical protein